MLDEIAQKFYGVQRRNPMGMFGDIFKVTLTIHILFNKFNLATSLLLQKHILLNTKKEKEKKNSQLKILRYSYYAVDGG